jgi:hypothetical protein
MEHETNVRKAYKKPQATKLTLEQAKLKLLSREAEGDNGARDLLRLMFLEVVSQPEKKKLD